MKSLRKSLNGGSSKDSILRAQISTPLPLPPVSKPPSAILPPQKVIRALAAYRPQAPQELPFQKGDFFYVLRDVDNQGNWYEAHNPVSGARGLVPRSMFEEFNKNTLPSRTSQVGPNQSLPQSPPIPPSPLPPKTQVFYAVVLHDFTAERADELDAKTGDSITVVAQSNREWFVAKPIGRLGRPGLIPVSFVEIHDPSTGKPIPDVEVLMDRGDLPKVEDWKRAMYNYKQNSIALGVIDAPGPTRDSMPGSPYMSPHSPLSQAPAPLAPLAPSPPSQPNYTNGDHPTVAETTEPLPDGILLAADVVSFHYEMEEYWFRIDAIFQPYAHPGQRLPPAKQLILFRVYNDFYDFQVSLLDTFPREAGRQPPHPRMLPYMPGPAQDVDDTLTASRRSELDTYVHSLCDLSKSGAKYILESQVVREFLALKPGDVGNETEARVQEIEALFGRQQVNSLNGGSRGMSELRDNLGRLKMRDDDEKSEGSDYEDEGYAPSPQRRAHDRDHHPYGQSHGPERRSNDSNLRIHAHAQNHQRTGSNSSFRATSPYTSHSRSHSRSNSPLQPERNVSAQPQRGNDDYYSYNNPASTPSTSSIRSSQATSRSRSQSVSTANNLNSPPISAANPQTAFVKIKIFDRVADDLIAIRVHPRVSHAELMDKVQARLGGEVGNLRYRDSGSNAFVGLDTDDELRSWIENTDKHVLYAD
ncbi:scd2/ral3 [Lyophyllum atratum]|nr:scd2/ral3 [Lyophyllum atratum]